MTPKERWLAALLFHPVDRLPFWPKVFERYRGLQSSPFCDMELDVIHDWIGSDNHTKIPNCIREVRKTTSLEMVTNGDVQVTIFRTRSGDTKLVKRFDKGSQSWHPIEFPVKNLNDIKLMTEWFSDCLIDLDKRQLEEAKVRTKEIGSQAATFNEIGQSPLMSWVEWFAGVESAHYLLADYPEDVEALFEVIHKNLLRKTEILCENSPCDILYLIEDTSTTLISPAQYRKICYRHIQEYALIAKNAGRLLVLHMCGQLKSLLQDIARLLVAGFEAFTSPPVGNTTLLDGRTACPDKCLIGGTNAELWTQSAEKIIAQIEEDLNALPHHRGLVITSGGEMPPSCKPETIKRVCEWLKRYNARM